MQQLYTQTYSSRRRILLYSISGGLMILSTLLGLFLSSVTIPVPVILHTIAERVLSMGWLTDVPANLELIIWEIRLPRVLLALLVGMALSVAGVAFQGLLRNPLADPYTIGVSSGASLGAVCVIFFNLSIWGLGAYTLPVVAILGGLAVLLLVYAITWISNRSLAVETLILAGIIVSSFVGSFISLIIALSGEELRQILYWLMGSVAMRGWGHVQLFLPFFVVGATVVMIHARELNAFALGEESAHHLGVQVKRRKLFLLLGASLLTGAAVAVSGVIAFVGLVIPHLVRLVSGPNHRHLLPLSMLVGGTFLVFADLMARTLIAPQELPIGVITAIIGAPVFALLLIRNRMMRRGG